MWPFRKRRTDAIAHAALQDAAAWLDNTSDLDPWSHPHFRSAHDFWRQEATAEGPPPASSIDPLRLPRRVLPHLAWGEYVGPPGRVRFRLAGQQVIDDWGRTFRGRTTDDLLGENGRCCIERCFAAAYRERRPILSEIVYRWPVLRAARAQFLLLPFVSAPGGGVSSVLMVEAWANCKGSAEEPGCADAVPEQTTHELRYCNVL